MTEKTLEEFLANAFSEYAAQLTPEIAEYRELVGAHNTIQKAEHYLIVQEEEAAKATKIREEGEAWIALAQENARIKIQRELDESDKAKETAKRLVADLQALKDKAKRLSDEKEKELKRLKNDINPRMAEVERRERAVTESENALNERKRIVDAA